MKPNWTIELADQIEAGKTDWRELDCLIYESMNPTVTPDMRGSYYGEWTGEYFPKDENEHPFRIPEYTTDPGAAITLALRMGAQEYELQLVRGRGYGRVTATKNGFVPEGKGYAATPAAALCSALIRLKLSEYMQ
jgi:hypothetical protein